MKQYVKEPTRGQYLLDLVISDLPQVRVKVLGILADHKVVLASNPIQISPPNILQRRGWNYKKANWPALKQELREMDWNFVHVDSLDVATERLTLLILVAAQKHIPLCTFAENKSQHPWLNTRCREAIAAKHSSEGSEQFEHLRDTCAAVINEEYLKHVAKTREDIKKCLPGSKQW